MLGEGPPKEGSLPDQRHVHLSPRLIEWLGGLPEETVNDEIVASYIQTVAAAWGASLSHHGTHDMYLPLEGVLRKYNPELLSGETDIAQGAVEAAQRWIQRGYAKKDFAERIAKEGIRAPMKHHRNLFISLFAEWQIVHPTQDQSVTGLSHAFTVDTTEAELEQARAVETDIGEIIEKVAPGDKEFLARMLSLLRDPSFIQAADAAQPGTTAE